LEIRMLSGGLVELEGPRWTEWIAVEVSDRGNEALLELLFGGDTDVAQDGAGQLGEEAFDEVEPGAVLGSEGELKPAGGLLGEPSSGLSGDMRGMIVEDQMDRRVGRIGRVDELEELRAAFPRVGALCAILVHLTSPLLKVTRAIEPTSPP